MQKLGRMIILILMVIITLILSGCSGKENALQIGIIAPSTNHLPFLIALEEGVFKEKELKIHHFSSGWEANEALINGKIDLGIIPFTYAWQAKSEKKDVRIISFLERESDGIIARKEITSFAELDGQRVGILRASTLDIFFHLLLAEYEITPEIIYFRSPTEMASALLNGYVDALSFYVPSIFLFDERFHTVLWYSDFFPDHPCCDVIVFEESLHGKRAQIDNFLQALNMGSLILQKEPERGIRAIMDNYGYDWEVAEKTLLQQKFITGLDESGIQFQEKIAKKMLELGYLRRVVASEEVFYDLNKNE